MLIYLNFNTLNINRTLFFSKYFNYFLRRTDVPEFAKWESKYPYSTRSWQNNWERLTNFYKYPPEIRKLIYTTNIIENFHGRLRKVTKTKRLFSSDMALMKLLYLIQKQFVIDNWQVPIFAWRTIQSQLSIIFDERFAK